MVQHNEFHRRLRLAMLALAALSGLLIFVAVPTAYFAVSYATLRDNLALNAHLSAERVAQRAQAAGSGWAADTAVLESLLALPAWRGHAPRQTVLGWNGERLARLGPDQPGPVLERSAAISVGRDVIGTVEVAASLRPVLARTLATAVGSALLGALAFWMFHRFPSRLLDRTLRQLDDSGRRLAAHMEETERAYEQLQRQHRRVEEAHHELAKARDEAEKANRIKSEFLANMSHELRTPLNAIIGFSDIIAKQSLGPGHPSYQEYAADIHSSGQHLLDLISNILDLSKIEAGRAELYLQPVSVPGVVRACLRLMRERAAAAGVELAEGPLPDFQLWADEIKLRQMLLNLVSNAVKFTPRGGRVTIGAACGKDGVEIRVADTGIGMRNEDIPVALEPFRQIESGYTRRYGGTGLGLPLTKALMELHGGRLEVTSAPGEGTLAVLWFPDRLVDLQDTPAAKGG